MPPSARTPFPASKRSSARRIWNQRFCSYIRASTSTSRSGRLIGSFGPTSRMPQQNPTSYGVPCRCCSSLSRSRILSIFRPASSLQDSLEHNDELVAAQTEGVVLRPERFPDDTGNLLEQPVPPRRGRACR